MSRWIEWFKNKVKPQEGWSYSTPEQFVRQREIQALWIGIIAFSLPVLLYYANRTEPCFRDSISHAYYVPFWGDIFVMLTTFVGISLLYYRGQSRWERWLARAAGICAILVALFPTSGSGCETTIASSRLFLFELDASALTNAFLSRVGSDKIHAIAAGVFFVILAIFNLAVFTATDQTNKFQRVKDNPNKRYRNRLYRVNGYIMLLMIALLGYNAAFPFENCNISLEGKNVLVSKLVCSSDDITRPSFWDRNNLTFYFEWVVLFCFSTAWIVKGRAGGVLFRDDKPHQILTKPDWWIKLFG